ncbi:MAG: hypothetical protein J0M17_09990 [Planctomycetes bacterium]|nr:hypothetical protein [Planctomycetota bacterium]
MDDLMRRVSVDDVLRFYGVASDTIQRVGDEIRARCFLNCAKTEPTGDRALAIKVDDDAKRWWCHSYSCPHKGGGNLVGLMDLLKPGEPMNGRPRGERFKAILGDLKEIAGGAPLSRTPTASAPPKPRIAEPAKVNLPLEENPNERIRAVVSLHERLVVDPLLMSPPAAGYVRRRPYLTPELLRKWKVGYLPFDAGGENSGGTMRGRIVYPIHDEQRRVLTYFSRDPRHEEKLAIWQAGDRSAPRPEKTHFVRGFHRGRELFGQHRLAEPGVREAIQSLGHLLITEGPNGVLRLDAIGVPAFAACSNHLTREQATKIARWCRELNVVAGVMFDCDAEGDVGAKQAVVELSQRCPVRLVWCRATFDGRFLDRQPDGLTEQEWEGVRNKLRQADSTG